MRDKYGVQQDTYCYPGSDVLINLLGITDGNVLKSAEIDFTTLRLRQYIYPSLQSFSFSSLKNIHFFLFQDLYEWAGEIRTVDISKGATRFATCGRIEPEASKLFAQLKGEHFLKELPRQDFVGRLAHYFCELNIIHPFRDGNGRAQRLLFEIIAINAGFQIRWGNIDPDSWIEANIAGYHCNLRPLVNLLESAITKV